MCLRASACTVMFVLYKVLSTLPHSLNHYWGGCPRCLLARTAQVVHYRNHVRGWPAAVLGKWALLDPSTSLSPNRTSIYFTPLMVITHPLLSQKGHGNMHNSCEAELHISCWQKQCCAVILNPAQNDLNLMQSSAAAGRSNVKSDL